MKVIRNYSFKEDLMSRFESVVPPGQRSSILSKLISDYCDQFDNQALGRKLKEQWMHSKVIPFIQQYAKVNKVDPYELWESKGLILALKNAGIEVTQEDIRSAIQVLLKEGT